MNLFIINLIIQYLLQKVTQSIVDKRTNQQLPQFVSNNIRNSLNQLERFGLIDTPLSNHQKTLNFNSINKNISFDNRALRNCKSIFVVKSKKNPQKLINRHTKSISNKSKNPNSFRSNFQSFHQKSSQKYQEKQNKSVGENFVKLQNQTQKQLKQTRQQQKLRHQLIASQFQRQQTKRKNSQIRKTRQQFILNAKNKMKDIKQFTFGYDFSLIKSKSNYVHSFKQENNTQRSFRKLHHLKTQVSNQTIHSKAKNSRHSHSTPKFTNIQTNIKIPQQKTKITKNFQKQSTFSQISNQSLVEIFRSKSELKKGVILKQKINGNIQILKKDIINTKSLFDLKRNQFQQSPQRKKFFSRYYRLEDIKLA